MDRLRNTGRMAQESTVPLYLNFHISAGGGVSVKDPNLTSKCFESGSGSDPYYLLFLHSYDFNVFL
jgi:hypothetical protein